MRTTLTMMMMLFLIGTLAVAVAQSGQASSPADSRTAWNAGYPLKGFRNADALAASFEAKAQNLGKDGKLRILIIGDSDTRSYRA